MPTRSLLGKAWNTDGVQNGDTEADALGVEVAAVGDADDVDVCDDEDVPAGGGVGADDEAVGGAATIRIRLL